jgi:hypothetical protein
LGEEGREEGMKQGTGERGPRKGREREGGKYGIWKDTIKLPLFNVKRHAAVAGLHVDAACSSVR